MRVPSTDKSKKQNSFFICKLAQNIPEPNNDLQNTMIRLS